MTHRIKRQHYADIFGPTSGARVRLGDTQLVAEVETDATVYGDECKFGGGKVLRDGMGQAAGVSDADALDCVITNALIIDWTAIRKADVGIKSGRIASIGKAGNPDVMAGVTPGMVVGVTTEAIAGEGLILTAGGIDSHIHFISPQRVYEALASGVTTLSEIKLQATRPLRKRRADVTPVAENGRVGRHAAIDAAAWRR